MEHYVFGQCVYTFRINFAKCKACDGQNRGCRYYTPMNPRYNKDSFAASEGEPMGRQYDGTGR